MNPDRISTTLVELQAELAALEPEWRVLEERKEILEGLVEQYRRWLALSTPLGQGMPKTITISSTNGPTDGKVSRSDPNNATARVIRILKTASPDYLSTREILKRMEKEGWSSKSEQKIRMLRSILHAVRGRHPEIEFEQRGDDGALFYRWTNPGEDLDRHASGVSGREEGEG